MRVRRLFAGEPVQQRQWSSPASQNIERAIQMLDQLTRLHIIKIAQRLVHLSQRMSIAFNAASSGVLTDQDAAGMGDGVEGRVLGHRMLSCTPRAGISSGTLHANATSAPKENKNAATTSRHTIVEMKLGQPSSAGCGSRSQVKPYMSAAS